jgi:hypothetical protein
MFNRIPGVLLSFAQFPVNPSATAGTQSSAICLTRELFPLSVNMEVVDKRSAMLQRVVLAGGVPAVVW